KQPNNITLEPGEKVTCTFTNVKRVHIIVDKVTLPSGDPQSFNFTTTGAGYARFALTDAAAPNDQSLVPGSYRLEERRVGDWDMKTATCTNGKQPSNITLEPGEKVTCTFTNVKRVHIIVDKVTEPSGDPQSFNFTTTGTGFAPFALTDAAAPNDQSLVPGSY